MTALGGRTFEWGNRVYVMGVVNVTPDSFSGDGRLDPEAAVAHGLRLVAEGADILDVGGESTRPGHRPVSAEVELARVLQVVRRLAASAGVPISIDTSKLEVARAAVNAGALIVNDVWGLQRSPGIADLAAERGCALVVMHNQAEARYDDLLGEVEAGLRRALRRALKAGLLPERVIVDPGIGFAKSVEDNLAILRHLDRFKALGQPLLLGTSRKGFIGRMLGGLPPEDRVEGTAATVAAAVLRGADIVRVHDVLAMTRVVRIAEQLRA